MKWLFLTLSFLTLSLDHAQARLGETREQSEARYGLPKRERHPENEPPLLEGARELIFHHSGFRIRCALLPATDGLEYIVREEYMLIKMREITPSEVDAMLSAEAGGSAWTKILLSDPKVNYQKIMASKFMRSSDRAWVRTDHATATMSHVNTRVRFELPHAWKWESQKEMAKAEQTKTEIPKF